MTVAEKIGQMALIEKNSISDPNDIAKYGLGALLSGAGAKPTPNTAEAWFQMVETFQEYAKKTRLGIPLFYGVDANHGHGNVPGATIFPHQIGLGASKDAGLVGDIAKATAEEVVATGINWVYSPDLDVAQDTRWGRTYETFGSDPVIAGVLGKAYIEGLQLFEANGRQVAATAKHYIGNGASGWGSSSNKDFHIDQGGSNMSDAEMRRTQLEPFRQAVKAGVRSIMVGLNTWNGDISQARVDEAVRRIVKAKFETGVFDSGVMDHAGDIGTIQHRELARKAVRESLVQLTNDGVVPISKKTSRLFVAGSAADNIGMQSGAWTVEWQGIDGNWIPGTSILKGIQDRAPTSTKVEYDLNANFMNTSGLADVGIAVVGERPYAEGWGDVEEPRLSAEDLTTIAKLKRVSKKIVVVIVSGRPLNIKKDATKWDAVIAAWLPGSEGEGVVDVLFGDFPFTGTLPVDWDM